MHPGAKGRTADRVELVVMAVLVAVAAVLEDRRVLLPPPQLRAAPRPRQCPPLAAAAVAMEAMETVEAMEAVEAMAEMGGAGEVQAVAVQAAAVAVQAAD